VAASRPSAAGGTDGISCFNFKRHAQIAKKSPQCTKSNCFDSVRWSGAHTLRTASVHIFCTAQSLLWFGRTCSQDISMSKAAQLFWKLIFPIGVSNLDCFEVSRIFPLDILRHGSRAHTIRLFKQRLPAYCRSSGVIPEPADVFRVVAPFLWHSRFNNSFPRLLGSRYPSNSPVHAKSRVLCDARMPVHLFRHSEQLLQLKKYTWSLYALSRRSKLIMRALERLGTRIDWTTRYNSWSPSILYPHYGGLFSPTRVVYRAPFIFQW